MRKPMIAASAALLVAVPAGPILAKEGRAEVRTAGQCTGAATWKLKVKEDDGGLEVEFEVDANVVGQAWDYTLRGPAAVLATGTRTTTEPSGSFSVEVATPGSITDTFSAVSTFNGQICDTSVTNPVSPSPRPTDDTPGVDDTPKPTPKVDDHPSADDTAAGSCTDDSVNAILRAKARKATLRVDSESRGEVWRYAIRRDGKLVKSGTARTKGSKGAFTIRAKSTSTGTFTATVTKVGSDDSCEISG